MVAPNDDAPEPRPPTLADLVSLCRDLNESGARYVVIGGMAIIQAGFTRTTEDIDLLVETTPDNIARLRAALMRLPDGAIQDMKDGDLDDGPAVSGCDALATPGWSSRLTASWRDAQDTQLFWSEQTCHRALV